ncbi:TetR/AcrR family transcriptional regulator [Phycicoccus flavus]|uniref:TetR/AcrR family transcriptional regulator n=1 Tax=Phycicoccus flavus TaxID=2502783 RepID=A0A8T6QYZ0_9MICO|nr:TetR family transcriptional regulator [Phycicoccus flavus]NHA66746.1 TetR/AcrR family transcriptional regulator [Phycicoccus flavus]
MPRARGRRPAGSHTREDIAAAAKRQFAELGYPRTTLRGIAREADVDTRLVTHYFGSKQNLFVTVVDFPFEPETIVDELLVEGPQHVGHRLAALVVETLDEPEALQTLTGLLRAAASEDEAAELVQRFLTERLLTPLIRLLGGDRAELRSAMLGAGLTGYIFARYVVRLPGLAQADPDVVVGAIGPSMQHYLTGDFEPSTSA